MTEDHGGGGGGLWAALVVGVVLSAAGLGLRLDDSLPDSSHTLGVLALALGGLTTFIAGTGIGVMLGLRAVRGY